MIRTVFHSSRVLIFIAASFFGSGAISQPIVSLDTVAISQYTVRFGARVSCPYPTEILYVQPRNFTLRENGQQKSFSFSSRYVESGAGPLTALVFGFGGNSSEGLDSCRAAALAFIDFEQGYAGPGRFGSTVVKPRGAGIDRTPIGHSASVLRPAVDTIGSSRCDNLWDYLILAIEDFGGTKGLCRALLFFSDGIDRGSAQGLDQAIAAARNVDLKIFPVAFGGAVADSALTRLGIETGGEYLRSPSPDRLDSLISPIVHDNHYQYCVFSYPVCFDGSHRAIELTAHDIGRCPAPAVGRAEYILPLDTATLTELRVSIGSATAGSGDSLLIPVTLESSRPDIMAPFLTAIRIDTSTAALSGAVFSPGIPDSLNPQAIIDGPDAILSISRPIEVGSTDTLAFIRCVARSSPLPRTCAMRIDRWEFLPGFDPVCVLPKVTGGRIRMGYALTLDSPDGGEVYCRNGFIPIVWSGADPSGISIDISGDGGGSYALLAEHVVRSPYYWNPGGSYPSGEYLLRIRSEQPGVFDESAEPFELRNDFDLLRQPQDVASCSGSGTGFSVIPGPGLSTRIQWQRSEDEGRSWMNIAGANKPSLGFVPPDSRSGTLYRVVTANVCAHSASAAARLWVYVMPGILWQPEDATVCEGDSALFRVTPEPKIPPQRIQWQLRPPGGAVFSNLPGDTSSTLVLHGLTQDRNQTAIRAVAFNPCDSTYTRTAMLAVRPKTAILVEPVSLSRLRGDSAVFSVTANGSRLKYQWYHDGILLAEETAPQLAIGHVESADQGGYHVMISGDCGPPVQSEEAYLKVLLSGFDEGETSLPGSIVLALYPNPFSDRTTIQLRMTNDELRMEGKTAIRNPQSAISLKMYDLLGREVLDLTSRLREAGEANLEGSELPGPGVYFCRLLTPRYNLVRAIHFIR